MHTPACAHTHPTLARTCVLACGCAAQQTYKPGDFVINQGEEGDNFYIIAEGRALVTKKLANGTIQDVGEIFQGQYFGERALLKKEPRAASVIAMGEGKEVLRVMYISKDSFEEVLGSLQAIMDEDSSYKLKVRAVGEALACAPRVRMRHTCVRV